MRERRRAILPGVFLILLGLWLLLNNLNLNLPTVGQLWPAFIILGGLIALGSYVGGQPRDPGQVFAGVAALGVGAFFFLFTLNVPLPLGQIGRVTWADMGALWPAFVIIGGIAFVAQYLASKLRDGGALFVGLAALAIGLIAFGFTLGFVGPDLGQLLANFWPVLLILVGLGLLLQYVRGRS
ncbi:MAG: hypothetical protein ACE5H9_02590 [Anaerolineae bacterium]